MALMVVVRYSGMSVNVNRRWKLGNQLPGDVAVAGELYVVHWTRFQMRRLCVLIQLDII